MLFELINVLGASMVALHNTCVTSIVYYSKAVLHPGEQVRGSCKSPFQFTRADNLYQLIPLEG